MMNPQYELIASAYNIGYRVVQDRADLSAAIEEMLAADGPFLLECVIKEDDDVLPMTPPGKNVDEMQLEI